MEAGALRAALPRAGPAPMHRRVPRDATPTRVLRALALALLAACALALPAAAERLEPQSRALLEDAFEGKAASDSVPSNARDGSSVPGAANRRLAAVAAP
jgi:hypothetical protein